MRKSSFFLLFLAACSDKDATTDTSGIDGTDSGDTTDTATTDSGETTPPFAPTSGTYAFTTDNGGGSCGEDNNISGAVVFTPMSITVDGETAFTMSYADDTFEDYVDFVCARTEMDFSCDGGTLIEGEQSAPEGEATASVALSAAGAWTDETHLGFTVTGTLSCEGEQSLCDEYASGWNVSMPCDMTRGHEGVLE